MPNKVANQRDKVFRECFEKFHMEYDSLEYLLLSLIDANDHPKESRAKRLQKAYYYLLGEKKERVDLPDSDISKGLFEYAKNRETNYNNQLKPEHGGPTITCEADEKLYAEKTQHKLASEIAEEYEDQDGNFHEYIYKRIQGKYRNRLIREDPNGHFFGLLERFSAYDETQEKALFDDLKQVAQILEKHGIAMKVEQPFWRLQG